MRTHIYTLAHTCAHVHTRTRTQAHAHARTYPASFAMSNIRTTLLLRSWPFIRCFDISVATRVMISIEGTMFGFDDEGITDNIHTHMRIHIY